MGGTNSNPVGNLWSEIRQNKPVSFAVFGMVLFAVIAVLYANNEKEKERREHERIEALWAQHIDRAVNYSAKANLEGDLIECLWPDLNPKPVRSSGNATADSLLAASEAPEVVFLVPGLNYHNQDGGWHTFDFIRQNFQDEISVTWQAQPSAVICMVRWPTLLGFGPKYSHLTQAIQAIVDLSGDEIIRSSAHRRIVIVGYSAGGNFAAYSLAQVNLLSLANKYRPDVRLVTVATPHDGSTLIDSLSASYARDGLNFGHAMNMLFDNDELRQHLKDGDDIVDLLPNSPGLQQLAAGNQDVANLNQAITELSSKMDFSYVNVYSDDDMVVGSRSGFFDAAIDVQIPNQVHEKFLYLPRDQPLTEAPLSKVLQDVEDDTAPTRATIRAALGLPAEEQEVSAN